MGLCKWGHTAASACQHGVGNGQELWMTGVLSKIYRGRDTGCLIDGCKDFRRHEGLGGWHAELVHGVRKKTHAPATADPVIAQLGAISAANVASQRQVGIALCYDLERAQSLSRAAECNAIQMCARCDAVPSPDLCLEYGTITPQNCDSGSGQTPTHCILISELYMVGLESSREGWFVKGSVS